MLKKVKFKGGFFSEESELELFMHEDRISILYGKNGSGKSTISKAVRKSKGDTVDDIVQATLYDQRLHLLLRVDSRRLSALSRAFTHRHCSGART